MGEASLNHRNNILIVHRKKQTSQPPDAVRCLCLCVVRVLAMYLLFDLCVLLRSVSCGSINFTCVCCASQSVSGWTRAEFLDFGQLSSSLGTPFPTVSHKGGHPNQQGHLLWLAESQTSRYASVYYGTGFRSGKKLGHRPTELCLGTTESAKCEMSPKCVTFSTAGNEKPGQPSGPAQCSNK